MSNEATGGNIICFLPVTDPGLWTVLANRDSTESPSFSHASHTTMPEQQIVKTLRTVRLHGPFSDEHESRVRLVKQTVAVGSASERRCPGTYTNLFPLSSVQAYMTQRNPSPPYTSKIRVQEGRKDDPNRLRYAGLVASQLRNGQHDPTCPTSPNTGIQG